MFASLEKRDAISADEPDGAFLSLLQRRTLTSVRHQGISSRGRAFRRRSHKPSVAPNVEVYGAPQHAA